MVVAVASIVGRNGRWLRSQSPDATLHHVCKRLHVSLLGLADDATLPLFFCFSSEDVLELIVVHSMREVVRLYLGELLEFFQEVVATVRGGAPEVRGSNPVSGLLWEHPEAIRVDELILELLILWLREPVDEDAHFREGQDQLAAFLRLLVPVVLQDGEELEDIGQPVHE